MFIRGSSRAWLSAVITSVLFFGASQQVSAQQPACVVTPVAGQSCVDVIIANPALTNGGRTGTASTPANDNPGNDASNVNHVIRTLDDVTYDVKFSVNNTLPSSGKVALTFTMPTGMEFTQPTGQFPLCNGNAGGVVSGQVLTCEVNVTSLPVSSSVPITGRVLFTTPDGTVLVPQVSIDTTGSNGPVARTGYQDVASETNVDAATCALPARATFPGNCGDMVSAAPKFDLEKGSYSNPAFAADARRVFYREVTDNGPGGLGTGLVIGYSIAIALPGDGKGGAPLTSTPAAINLVDKLDFSPATPNFGTLLGCSVNADGSGRPITTRSGASGTALANGNYPFGKIGYTYPGFPAAVARNSVADSGSIACTQPAAGADVSIAITTAANQFAPASIPERQMNDTSVLPRKYVGVYNIYYFYPAAAILAAPNNRIVEKNRVGEPSATNASGIQGLSVSGNVEPDDVGIAAIDTGVAGVSVDDTDSNNFGRETLVGGEGGYKVWRQTPDSTTAGVGSCLDNTYDPGCRHGTAYQGQVIASDFFVDTRTSLSAYNNFLACDEWDKTKTNLTTIVNAGGMWPAGFVGTGVAGIFVGNAITTAGAQVIVEYSTTAGTNTNVDYANDPSNGSRDRTSAAECSSGTWQAAQTLNAPIASSWQAAITAADFGGAANLANVARIRVRVVGADFGNNYLFTRSSQIVLPNPPGTWLPNRTSITYDGIPAASAGNPYVGVTGDTNNPPRRYWENDHARITGAKASVAKSGSASAAALNQTVTFTITPKFAAAGPGVQVASTSPVVVRDYLPAGYTFVPGSATPAVATAPVAGVKPTGFQNVGQASTVLEWQFTNPTPGAPLPVITYQATVNLDAVSGTPLRNEVEITHPLDPSNLTDAQGGGFNSAEDRYAYWEVTPSIPSELVIQKATTTPFIEVAGTQQWQLQYKNNTGGTFASMRIIDLLPFNGDAINTSNDFNGGFNGGTLTALPASPVASVGTYSYFYSTTAVANINRNPRCVSNGGAIADGAGQCPNSGATWTAAAGGVIPAGATAFRVDDAAVLGAGVLRGINLEIATVANKGGDLYENSFQAADPTASLVINSNKPQIRVPEATLSGYVYEDPADDGDRTGDTGIGNVTLTLAGTDIANRAVNLTTTTCASATCATSTVQDGANTITCTPPVPLVRGQYYFCGLATSNATGYTLTETQPTGYGDGKDGQSATVAGTLLSGSAVGTVATPSTLDRVSGIRITNNTTTGVGDVGTEFNFGELVLTTISGRVYVESNGNTTNEPAADQGIGTVSVALSCTPAYTGTTPVQTAASDGTYSFAGVLPGANCTVTQTQPSPYTNAYVSGGANGVGTPETAGSTTNGVITITNVPATGSPNNNFAEQAADMQSSIACVPPGPAGGASTTCTVTCTNNGPGVAVSPLCTITNASSLPGNPAVVCTPNPLPASLANPGSVSCSVTFNAPNSGSLTINGSTGATNDNNGGTNLTGANSGNNPSSTQINIVPADMRPAFSNLPAAVGPGTLYTGLVLTCSNVGSSTATQASCVPTASAGTVSNVVCVAQTPVDVVTSGTIRCTFDYTAPPAQGGTNTTETTIDFFGRTTAGNDSVGGSDTTVCAVNPVAPNNNCVQAAVPVVDAIDDTPSTQQFATTGSTNYPLLSNDQLGATTNPAIATGGVSAPTITGVTRGGTAITNPFTIDPATGALVVPNNTPPGVYVVTYQICANGTTNACDTATKTVTIEASDMTSSIVCTPSGSAAGTPMSCVLTCTNNGPNIANNATCGFTSGLPAGTTVSCVPTSPATTVAVSGTIVCTTASFPTPSTPTQIIAGTGAENDSNGGATPAAGNNPAQALVGAPPVPVPVMGAFGLGALLLMLIAAATNRRRATR